MVGIATILGIVFWFLVLTTAVWWPLAIEVAP